MYKKYVPWEEVEKDLTQNAPPIVYKFRTWSDPYHRRLLENREAWFAHPFTLNDPLDVRPHLAIDLAEVKELAFLDKLLASVKDVHPWLNSERDRRIVAENQWELLKSDPQIILSNRQEYIETEENFDQYGIFSTGMNPLSDKLWREYAEDYTGYCVGFKTVPFCRQVKSSYSAVTYSDEPLPYSFLTRTEEQDLDELYTKKTIWAPEEEFRFITLGVGIYSSRLQTFSADTVSEILLGGKQTPEVKTAILDTIAKIYSTDIPIYCVTRSARGIPKKALI